jgi:hypothetical protein
LKVLIAKVILECRCSEKKNTTSTLKMAHLQ